MGKKKKDYEKEITRTASITMMIFGITVLMTGLHNIDNAWNMQRIESSTGTSLMDCSKLECAEAEEIYGTAIVQSIMGGILIALPTTIGIGFWKW